MIKNSINILNLSNFEFQKKSMKSYNSESAEVSKKLELEELGFHLEKLKPKSFSCPNHAHSKEEEIFLILEGSLYVREDDKFYEAVKGDLIVFKKGKAHQFFNHTIEDCIYLALSNNARNDEVIFPDSNKKWSRTSKKLTMNGEEIDDYWKGELNPEKFWPFELLNPKE